MNTPAIPERKHSLTIPGSTTLSFMPKPSPVVQTSTPTELITIAYALKQAEQAVIHDTDNDTDLALFYYREALLSIQHFLHWERVFSLTGSATSTPNEWLNLESVCQKYRERVNQIGESLEYTSRPHKNTLSVWASHDTVRVDAYTSAQPFIHPLQDSTGDLFWLFDRIGESLIMGAFITPKIYIPKLIWEQKLNVPFSDIKANYLESLIPHYMELARESDPKKIAEILAILNGILVLLKNSIEKRLAEEPADSKAKLWTPIFKTSNPSLASKNTSSNNSLTKLYPLIPLAKSHSSTSITKSATPSTSGISFSTTTSNRTSIIHTSPPKKPGLKEKFKRLTTKQDKEYSNEYVLKLEDFINAFMSVRHKRGIEEHCQNVSLVVLAFVLNDLDYLMQSHVKSIAKT